MSTLDAWTANQIERVVNSSHSKIDNQIDKDDA